MLGVSGALPFLEQKPQKIRSDMQDVGKSPAILSEKQITEADRFQTSLAKVGEAWDGLKNDLGAKFVLPWAQPLVDALSKTLTVLDNLVDAKTRFDKAFGNLLSGPAGVAKAGGDIGQWIGGQVHQLWSGAPGGPQIKLPGAAPGALTARGGLSGGNQVEAFFRAHGFSAAAARGIAAGVFAEGGSASAKNPFSSAFGLGQWLLPRQGDFRRWSGGKDIHGSSLDQQMQFMLWELTHTEKGAGDRIRGARSADDAMSAYVRDFMRPGPGTLGDLRRGRQALGAGGQLGAIRLDVNFNNAPRGTRVQTNTTPNIDARIGLALETGEI
jgi:hypothetical protein